MAYLQKHGFNPQASQIAGKAFRDTIDFVTRETGDAIVAEPDKALVMQAGDWVQWESQGAFQFQVPKRITSLSQDGSFAFVEGTTTGIPTAQLRKAEAPPADKNEIPPKLPAGIIREVSALDEGEAVLQWPATLSSASVEELEEWLQLVIKKVKRRVGTK